MTSEVVQAKACTKCAVVKSVDQFERQSSKTDGRASHCKACRKAYKLSIPARASQPPAAKRCRTCSETKPAAAFGKRADSLDGLQRECKECINDRMAGYQSLEKYRAQYYKHRGPKLARQKVQKIANRDRIRETSRRWRAVNREHLNEARQARHARMRATVVGPIDLDALWTGLCGICGEHLDRNITRPDVMSKSIDHIIPLARGGTHTQDNLQWAHLRCNCSKGDKLPGD